jgi:hypothetical protein
MSDIVEELRLLQSGAQWACGQTAATLEEAADEIERLRAERDQAKKVRSVAIREMTAMARDAGGWRGLSEGKDIVIRQLETDRDRLRQVLEDIAKGVANGPRCHAIARAALGETPHD